MKIFNKKIFRGKKQKEIDKLKEIIDEQKKLIKDINNSCIETNWKFLANLDKEKTNFEKIKIANEKLKISNEEYKKNNDELNIKLVQLSSEVKSLKCAKGGIAKEKNKLLNKIINLENEKAELLKQIEDLKSDRYLIKKIPTGRIPNKQKINSLNCHKGSKAIKFVKDNC